MERRRPFEAVRPVTDLAGAIAQPSTTHRGASNARALRPAPDSRGAASSARAEPGSEDGTHPQGSRGRRSAAPDDWGCWLSRCQPIRDPRNRERHVEGLTLAQPIRSSKRLAQLPRTLSGRGMAVPTLLSIRLASGVRSTPLGGFRRPRGVLRHSPRPSRREMRTVARSVVPTPGVHSIWQPVPERVHPASSESTQRPV